MNQEPFRHSCSCSCSCSYSCSCSCSCSTALRAGALAEGTRQVSSRIMRGVRQRFTGERLLTFQPGHRDPLNKRPLGEEEEHDDGEHDQGGGGHEHVPLGAAVLALVELQAERQRKVALVGQVDE